VSKKNVLVIDDDTIILSMIKKIKLEAITIKCVSSLSAAKKALSTKFDLIISVLTGALRRFLISKYAKIPLSKLMEVLKWKITINYLRLKKTFRFGVLKEKEEHLFL
jgi:hypothetical protein